MRSAASSTCRSARLRRIATAAIGPGDNLFSSSVVAADARTGKYLWHFQVVRHDIWDADVANPPLLLDVRQQGRTIPAVAVMSKSGLLFLLDRVTGKPIYGVEDRPVPQSEVPLERTAKTQPFPVKPPPLSRMTMTPADIATVTPELEAACRKMMEGLQLGGPYLPVGYNRLRLQFPGNHGGVNWGGASFNPQLGYLFVNTSELGQLQGFAEREPNPAGAEAPAGRGGRGSNSPYRDLPGGGRFKDHESNMMCQQPPWGQLTAVNVHTGEFAWQVRPRRHRQPAARQAEDRPARERRIDRHGRRTGLRRRDRRQPFPRLRRQDGHGTVDGEARRNRARDAEHVSRQGRQAVRRHHVHRRRLPRGAGDRRQHHRVRAAGLEIAPAAAASERSESSRSVWGWGPTRNEKRPASVTVEAP